MNDSPHTSRTHIRSALNLTELGTELKERCQLADKYLTNLRQLFAQVNRTIVTLQSTSKHTLLQARRTLLDHPPSQSSLCEDYDRLLSVIDTQLADFEEMASAGEQEPPPSERIRLLEARNRLDLPTTHSSRSIKADVDEKYPESWSRDSSIDLNTVVNLPPVPEDVFSAFTTDGKKPKRSSSLSSLKSMRKVKLFLQRAENFDDDELSSDDDHDMAGHRVLYNFLSDQVLT